MRFSLASMLALSMIVPTTVTEAVKKDDISIQDCRKWYTIYKGANLYVKEYDAIGSNDFGDIFDKLAMVRDKADPKKGNVNFIEATNPELLKYKTLEYTPENKTDLADDLYNIAEGLKKAMEDKNANQ
jgi:hypothetical protein